MSYGPNASRQYMRNTVLTASPEQLQLMLIDGAIRFTQRGLAANQQRDFEAAFNAFDRAQRIVIELGNGMRREVNPTLVDQMASLYNFIYRRLVDAHVKRDATAGEDALRILRHQRETWQLIIEKLAADREDEAPAAIKFPAPAIKIDAPSLNVEV